MRGLGLLLVGALVSVAGAAPVAAPPASPEPCELPLELPLEGAPTPYELATAGQSWRIATRRGPIHVWVPNGYDPATAATVIFVHGYYIGVDGAWREHRLPEQFAASRLNALFIACGAPEGPGEPVTWASLGELLGVVARAVPIGRPGGRVVAIGHSGAYRTLESWLGDARLDTVALVDGAYGELVRYRAWLLRSGRRRLIDVGGDTRWRTDPFHRSLPGTYVVEGFPAPEEGALPEGAERARVLYIRAARDHMDLVTDGVALPMILRALRAPLVDDGPRSAPLSPLPRLGGEAC